MSRPAVILRDSTFFGATFSATRGAARPSQDPGQLASLRPGAAARGPERGSQWLSFPFAPLRRKSSQARDQRPAGPLCAARSRHPSRRSLMRPLDFPRPCSSGSLPWTNRHAFPGLSVPPTGTRRPDRSAVQEDIRWSDTRARRSTAAHHKSDHLHSAHIQ